jgi:hypothetical protein
MSITRILCAAALAVLISRSAQAQSWPMNSSALRHDFGHLADPWWVVTPAEFPGNGTRGATRAPSLTGLYGEYIGVATLYTQPYDFLYAEWRVDARPPTSSTYQLLASKPFFGTPSQVPSVKATYLLPFNVTSPSLIVDVRTDYGGGGEIDQCGLQILSKARNGVFTYDVGQYTYHEIGYRVPSSNDWEVNPTSSQCVSSGCAGKFLTYGPYWNISVPSPKWEYVAAFHLSLDSTTPTSNDVIATIEAMAWNGTASTVIASQDIRRHDFKGDRVMTTFPLRFGAYSNYNQFQFRVRYKGIGVLRQSSVDILKLETRDCVW